MHLHKIMQLICDLGCVHHAYLCLFFLSVKKGTKLRIADFVHGVDGLGNQNFPPPKGKPIDQSAVDFLIEQAKLYPGKVTVVALGPLTNIALVRDSNNFSWLLIINSTFDIS